MSLFSSNSTQKYLAEAIKSYLGADRVHSTDSDNYFVLSPGHDGMVVTLSWRANSLAAFHRSEKAFAEAFYAFLDEVSSRITKGEVADLRKQVTQLESQARDREKLIEDLQRYKTAYELNK